VLDNEGGAPYADRVLARVSAACLASVVLWALLVSGGTAAAPPTCGVSLGDQLEKRLPVGPFDKRKGQTLCFDFTGDGRQDIVFSGWEYATNGAHYWAAFRATSVGWTKVIFKRDCCRVRRATKMRIAHVGRVIVVTQPIFKTNDPGCCPTGGRRTGRWRWTGGALKLISVTPKADAP
jgi:hypothetical protein